MIDWDDLIAELVIAGLGSWDAVAAEITLPRLYALRRCWRRRGAGTPANNDLSDLVSLLGGPGPIR